MKISNPYHSCIRFAILAVVSTVFFHQSFAQEASISDRQINWQSLESIELHSGQSYSKPCVITTKQDQGIDLVCGSEILTFSIEEIKGSWTDPSSIGSLTYKVSYQEMPGKIVVSRSTGQVSALFDFTEKDKNGMKRKFIITEIN